MYFKQFYLGCLAHASYLIGSEGEAAVVDPQRDIEQYINEAEAEGLKIKYVIETHLHADFVSGHRELAERAGARIVFGRKANAAFDYAPAKDGDEFRIGKVILRVLETPGHTPESISILVTDAEVSNQPQKVLTGDTLFIGDVGRPDLVSSIGFTAEQMAGMLYDSLQVKLLRLDDAVEVWPAHGKGSLCGRNMSNETSSTIGRQRQFNYALQPMGKEEFVKMMTADLPEAPAYFSKDAEMNRGGARPLTDLPRPAALTPLEVNHLAGEGVTVLDARPNTEFGAGHVPGALNIGLSGQFASWAGQLIKFDAPIVVVAEDESKVDEAVMRLARVGIENVKGYLAGGMDAWRRAGLDINKITQISVDDLSEILSTRSDLQVIDVRQPGEYDNGHVPSAVNAPLARVGERASEFDPNRQTAVICAGGFRSSAATSILERRGFKNLLNVLGGTGEWITAGYPIEGAAKT
ncbi:MAG TPA: MBL fold metallo-hydrolase [Blastocatellia bacterium]|nr:MBL fold metallo-hydrolase [Blastocatellia bacterium]